jgi:hypothetical protein
MPQEKGGDLMKTLIGCPTQTFSVEPDTKPVPKKDRQHYTALSGVFLAILLVVFFSL